MTEATQDPRLDPDCPEPHWLAAIHPHFTPDINLGHLLQAIVVVTTVGGGILAGYLSLRDDLERQRAEFRVALAGHEARLTVAEHVLEERRAEERQFQTEMRTALDRVMQGIADLRTELVHKQDRK
jgi:GAF domain-containing protein